jgi:peptidoglycan/xylan/chitin deacetylase (PgdA/CDA1 family)
MNKMIRVTAFSKWATARAAPTVCVLILFVLSCVNTSTPPRLFFSPIVVITFDDAHPSVYGFAFPAMRAMDGTWAATHFFPATYAGPQGTITLNQLKEMEKAGWETGGHGVTHENLSSVLPVTVESQVKEDNDFLTANGLSHESYAYAFGNYNDTVKAMVKKYFMNIRTAHDYEYLDGVNRTELGYYAVKSGCSADDLIARVEMARSIGSPLVIIGFHAVIPDTAPPVPMYWCKESVFMGFLRYLKNEEFPVMTLKKAMKELCR